jgi:hypothetical protein
MSKLYNEKDYIDAFYELENGWWWYSTINYVTVIPKHGNVKRRIKESNIRNRWVKSFITPYICDKCDYVWTEDIYQGRKVSIIHDDFPRFKLKCKTCQFCDGDKNNEQIRK